jgi:SnoaL-like domain
MSEELATLLAKQAVTDSIHRYCRAMDRMDHDLAVATWHPGGTADYGSFFQGSGAGFVEWVEATHRGMRRHVHSVSNILIEVDGAEARSETYVTVLLRFLDGAEEVETIAHGRYLDRWSCRDGRWAIEARRYIHDFGENRPVRDDAIPSTAARDRTDPSYAWLESGGQGGKEPLG